MPSNYTKKNGSYRGKTKYIPDPNNYLYNIDTLWLNCGSPMYNDVMDFGLRDILIDGRNDLQEDGLEESLVEVNLKGYENPLRFAIRGGNPPLYQCSLRNDSMAIYFSKTARDNGQLPMRVQINQFPLWEKGVEGAYFEAMEVLATLGFVCDEVRINRVDFAVHSDQFKWTFSDFATFDYPRNIKDDNKPNFFKLDPMTGDFGTMMVGDRSRLAIRIYNKSKEIEDKQKFYFYDLYNRHNMDINNVWNIEIECRRPFLKEICEDDEELKRIFDDFNYCLVHNGLSRLWSLLLEKYNHDSAHWNMLKKLDNHFNFNSVHGLTVHKDINANFEREIPQILGRLSQAVINHNEYSLEKAIQILIDKIPEYEEKRESKGKKIITFEERVEKKKSMIQNYDINLTLSSSPEVEEVKEMTSEEKLSLLIWNYRQNNQDLATKKIRSENAMRTPKEIREDYLKKNSSSSIGQ